VDFYAKPIANHSERCVQLNISSQFDVLTGKISTSKIVKIATA